MYNVLRLTKTKINKSHTVYVFMFGFPQHKATYCLSGTILTILLVRLRLDEAELISFICCSTPLEDAIQYSISYCA
jgi:hypothetical protein